VRLIPRHGRVDMATRQGDLPVKPTDSNSALPPHERPLRVLLIAGSDRRQYNCPGVDSKARALMVRLADLLPEAWEIDLEDLGNVYGRAQIRTCNACVSTSMALCCWPCNCYEKGSLVEPDLMWNLDLYARLDQADAWAIIGPVNWYGPTSNLKSMFDRLVCMNGGNPHEEIIAHKDPEKAMALERLPEWAELSQNHLEGRSAAFFCYGDGGGDELDEQGRPKVLRHPAWFDPEKEPFASMRDAYAPLVWQCRYGGIEVPDELWRYCEFGGGKKYADNQAEHMASEPQVYREFDAWAQDFQAHVASRGQVTPGKYRAYGRVQPGHLAQDAALAWREIRMRLGVPRQGSSPAQQQVLGLNRDVTLTPGRSERTRLPLARPRR